MNQILQIIEQFNSQLENDFIMTKEDELFINNLETFIKISEFKVKEKSIFALYDDTFFGSMKKSLVFFDDGFIVNHRSYHQLIFYSEIKNLEYKDNQLKFFMINKNKYKSKGIQTISKNKIILVNLTDFSNYSIFNTLFLKMFSSTLTTKGTELFPFDDSNFLNIQNNLLEPYLDTVESVKKAMTLELMYDNEITNEINYATDSLRDLSNNLGIIRTEPTLIAIEKATSIFENTKEYLQTKQSIIKEYFEIISKMKQEIANELYNISIGPILDVYGYFGKKITEFSIIEECCQLDNYNFKINSQIKNDFLKKYNKSIQINEAKNLIGNKTKKSTKQVKKSTNKMLKVSANALNKKELSFSDELEICAAGIEMSLSIVNHFIALGTEICEKLNQHFENMEKLEKYFFQIVDTFKELAEQSLIYEEYLYLYKSRFISILSYYNIYCEIKKNKLIPALDKIYATDIFKEYLEERSTYKEEYLNLFDKVTKLEKLEYIPPSKALNILTLSIAAIIKKLHFKKIKSYIDPLKKECLKKEQQFASVEAIYIPQIQKEQTFMELHQDIKSSLDIIKKLRNGINEKLSLEK